VRVSSDFLFDKDIRLSDNLCQRLGPMPHHRYRPAHEHALGDDAHAGTVAAIRAGDAVAAGRITEAESAVGVRILRDAP
jgi:hypothetical protein